ncbi:MAG: hypothetical protein U0835_18385 [Isosphaeraceae bacterium]
MTNALAADELVIPAAVGSRDSLSQDDPRLVRLTPLPSTGEVALGGCVLTRDDAARLAASQGGETSRTRPVHTSVFWFIWVAGVSSARPRALGAAHRGLEDETTATRNSGPLI